MQPKLSRLSADSVIDALARRQNGVAHREQLLRAGITAQQIRSRLRDGRLKALHRGVYLVGAVPPLHAYPQAAVFACRPHGVVGCFSAAGLWSVRRYPADSPPWLIVPTDTRFEHSRIHIRRRDLAPSDIQSRFGMPVTSPARTAFDIAAILDAEELEWLVAEMIFMRITSEDQLRAQVERNGGTVGVPVLREVLDLEGGPQRTRSLGERAFLRLLRKQRIAGFEANAEVHGYEVDFLWRAADFCVELDGWDGHSSRAAFERDRLKWAELQARGTRVMPITGRQLRDDAEGVFRRLRAALEHRLG